jgi:hypothetical protein
MKRLIVICLAALLTLPACSEDDTATSPGGEFDTNLIGYWYRAELSEQGSSVRPGYHHVFFISPEGLYQACGVETATGKIAPLAENRDLRIHFAKNGRIGLSWFLPPAAGWDTLDYQVEWNVLSIAGESPISGVWTRKTAGQVVTEPLLAQFSCTIDGVQRSIPSVAGQMAAWVTLKPSFAMRARITGVGTSAVVFILIPEFTGPGSYSLANANGQYHVLNGDMVTSFITDALYSGTITIDNFDSAAQQISGSFEFTARRYRDTGNPPDLITFTNGRFSVPTYP